MIYGTKENLEITAMIGDIKGNDHLLEFIWGDEEEVE